MLIPFLSWISWIGVGCVGNPQPTNVIVHFSMQKNEVTSRLFGWKKLEVSVYIWIQCRCMLKVVYPTRFWLRSVQNCAEKPVGDEFKMFNMSEPVWILMANRSSLKRANQHEECQKRIWLNSCVSQFRLTKQRHSEIHTWQCVQPSSQRGSLSTWQTHQRSKSISDGAQRLTITSSLSFHNQLYHMSNMPVSIVYLYVYMSALDVIPNSTCMWKHLQNTDVIKCHLRSWAHDRLPFYARMNNWLYCILIGMTYMGLFQIFT